jgi:putative nucleotidyltransferase with HDIG domain
MESLRFLYEKHGGSAYYGELVTQYQHALQSAYSAEQYAPNDHELIIAALLHDIGHLLGEKKEDFMGNLGVLRHESIGAEYLRKKIGLSERICYLVENHVNAKRYLTHIDQDYYNHLSDASKQTLVYQGGPMNDDEAEKFRSHSEFELCLRMRTFDEAAKDIHFNKYEETADRYWNLVQESIQKN